MKQHELPFSVENIYNATFYSNDTSKPAKKADSDINHRSR